MSWFIEFEHAAAGVVELADEDEVRDYLLQRYGRYGEEGIQGVLVIEGKRWEFDISPCVTLFDPDVRKPHPTED